MEATDAPLQLKKVISQSTVDNIITQLVEAIISGELKPGDRLPTETALMNQLDVGRNSVREAIKVLVSYGILEIHRADGTFVCTEFSPKMLNPLIYGIFLETDMDNLDAFRQIIEDGILRLAIKTATDEDIERLKVVVDQMKDCIENETPTPDGFMELDLAFHKGLADCTHNPILQKINDVLSLLLTQSRFRNINAYMESSEGVQFLLELHVRYYELVKSRDPATISQIIDDSLRDAVEVVRRADAEG